MRSTDLLKKAADALDDGQIPLMNPFLADNEVTLDECYNLGDQLAMGARLGDGMAAHMYTEILKRLAES